MDERAGDPGPGERPAEQPDDDSGSKNLPTQVHVHGRVSDQTLADYPLLAAGTTRGSRRFSSASCGISPSCPDWCCDCRTTGSR